MKATLTFLFSLVLIFRSSAGTRTWTANGGNDLWSNTNNWSPKGFPGSADDLVFPGADSNNSMNNLAGLTVRSLTFSVGHNLGGNPIRVASGIFVDSGASLGSTNVTISADLTPTAMQTFQVSSGALSISGGINLNGQNLTFDVRTGSLLTANGVITGTGNLFKIFGGTLEIGGASGNTYSGFFTINRGLVRLNKQSGNAVCGPLTIGTILDSATVALLQSYQLRSSNSITINGNGVLDVDEQVQSLGPLTFNAGTTAITNIITRNGGTVFLRDVTITGGSAKIFGIVWVPFDSVFDCAQDSFLEIEGDLGGSGAIIKEGLGDLSLYGTNSFIGPVFINNGSLFAGGARPFGASSGVLPLETGSGWRPSSAPEARK